MKLKLTKNQRACIVQALRYEASAFERQETDMLWVDVAARVRYDLADYVEAGIDKENTVKKNRAPRCHDALSDADQMVITECDRKAHHKGAHRMTAYSSSGQVINAYWEDEDTEDE